MTPYERAVNAVAEAHMADCACQTCRQGAPCFACLYDARKAVDAVKRAGLRIVADGVSPVVVHTRPEPEVRIVPVPLERPRYR